MKYKDAGVDIELANLFVRRIKETIEGSRKAAVLRDIGSYGGIFRINLLKYTNPLLVASTDGVGSKIWVAMEMGKLSTIGIDLVAMGVNDIIVHGAEPLFFLDYLAMGKLRMEEATNIIEGIVEGCKMAGCALIGGETAEMPYIYKEGDFDLAGFTVGIVDADKLIDGSSISIGDRIIGISSSGFHSNGYSLLIKTLIEKEGMKLTDPLPYDPSLTIGEELLTPTFIYVRVIMNLLKDFDIKGIAHITGGGLIYNIPRILPPQCKAEIMRENWTIPHRFEFVQNIGNIDDDEMFKVFNMGIGMVLVVEQSQVEEIIQRIKNQGYDAFMIGEITKRGDGEAIEIH